ARTMASEGGCPALPTALRHTGDVTREGQLPETETAHAELPDVGAGSSAPAAPVVVAHLELQRLLLACLLGGRGHGIVLSFSSSGTACPATAGACAPRRRSSRSSRR